ncbi:MAG: EAL domain-containing protein [Campylobacterota bacterium]|nr:EAL domain-containing protein [Campylobacterota bacterium]
MSDKDNYDDISSRIGHKGNFTPDGATALKITEALDRTGLVSATNCKGEIVYVNDNFCELMGYSRDELLGNTHAIMKHEDTQKVLFEDMWNAVSSGKEYQCVVSNRCKDGALVRLGTTVFPIFSKSGDEIVAYIAIRIDETEHYKKELEIQKRRVTDEDTGLGNKVRLLDDLKKSGGHIALIDLNEFSAIHGSYGQDVSKEVLNRFGFMLKKQFKQMRVYRVYADVFALLDNDESKSTNAFSKDVKLGARILLKNQKIVVDEIEIILHFTTSIAKCKSRAIERCESAMKYAKRNNIDFAVYDEKMESNASDIQQIRSDTLEFASALEQRRIVSYFQPISNNETGVIEKYECLARLIKRDGTLMRPDIFIGIARKINKYEDVTRIMIKNTFEYFKDKHEVSFSVNISAEDIKNGKTYDFIFRQLDIFPNPGNVVFELLEDNDLSKEIDIVRGFIQRVHQYGCKVAIDDFGTGYSNFTTFAELQVDFLKIDGSIIKKLGDKASYDVAKAIVDMAKALGLMTIAEFVCDDEILEKVKELGIDYSQGFHIGKPEADILQVQSV